MLGSLVVGSFAGWIVFFYALLVNAGPWLAVALGASAGVVGYPRQVSMSTVLAALWSGYSEDALTKRPNSEAARDGQ